AVKILRPELAADSMVRQRFESEARTSARLSHPNVVNVFDAGYDDESVYLVMERLPGETLDDELAAGPMAVDRVVSVGVQVLDALAAAHAAGVIHRDIKPSNVLTCPDGVVKVADFGIATVAGAASVTATGLIIGTPAYLAPERAEGQPASERSDVYSVGAVLYTCLTGRRPFEADSAVALMAVMQIREPTPIRELRSEVSAGLAAVVARAMAKDPAGRFGSAAEMAAALLAVAPPDMVTTGEMAPADATSVMAAAGLAGAAGRGAVRATGVVSAGSSRPLVREGRAWRGASILLVGAAVLIVLAAVGWGLVHGGSAATPGGTTTTTNRKTATTSTTASTSTSTSTSAPTSTSTSTSTSTTSEPSTTTSTTSGSTSVTVTIPTSTSSPPTTQAPATTTTTTAASSSSSG
ncbi:MAG: serine/threonine-protein kinase, partial [Acidimicrobiales bacterium]